MQTLFPCYLHLHWNMHFFYALKSIHIHTKCEFKWYQNLTSDRFCVIVVHLFCPFIFFIMNILLLIGETALWRIFYILCTFNRTHHSTRLTVIGEFCKCFEDALLKCWINKILSMQVAPSKQILHFIFSQKCHSAGKWWMYDLKCVFFI